MSIALHDIRSGYDDFRLDGVTLEIATGSRTALIGPNGCGKSTLLKTIARQLHPGGGRVEVAGQEIATLRSPAVARLVSILPQHPIVPPGIGVETLVGYGRAPHQNFLGVRTPEDQENIEAALEITSLTELRARPVTTLSGGQRQRAFIAMCIAQDTPYVLFDEPTSFLDIRYQYEVLDLLAQLNAAGKTVIVVLHEIAQAARYATDLLVMKAGAVHARGAPDAVVTPEMVAQVYGIEALVYADPVSGTAVVSPLPAPAQGPDSVVGANAFGLGRMFACPQAQPPCPLAPRMR